MWGGRRPWTTSRRRASHAACRMAASGLASFGLAGIRVQIFSKVCTKCTLSRLPAPSAHFTQRQSSRKVGADHHGRWAGAWGGEGSELEVLKGQWGGQGLEDSYGRRGEREARCCSWGEGDVDMGRQWRAWRRLGKREWRGWGLGMEDAYGRRGEREARCCSWGEGDVNMGRRWRAWRRPGERERQWWGLGVKDAYGRRGEREARCSWLGEGDTDMGQRWHAGRCLGERKQGFGGSWRRLGERERRE